MTSVAPSRDVYAHVTDLDEATAASLADRMDLRASDPRRQALWDDYLSRAPFAAGARVLEGASSSPR